MRFPKLRAIGVFFVVLLYAFPSFAQEETAPTAPPADEASDGGASKTPLPPPVTWKASAELGLILSTGNTKSTTVNGGTQGEIAYGSWSHEGKFEALFTQQDDPTIPGINKETTAQRFVVSEKTNYSFSKRHYVFVTARYEDDKFSGFDWRLTEAAGYGIKAIDEANVTLKLEAGPGGRHSHTPAEIGPPPVPAENQNEFVGRGAMNFEWRVSDTATLTEDVTTVIGPKKGGGVITESITALKAQVAGGLSMSASFTVQHTNNPPDLKKDIDTRTALTLVYAFGSEQKK